ncbi:MAG: amino acid adenylation domain-containing protein [Cyclobacteriaceae bacterium]|nr:amino acid adenylation domain-containing protein [Cyclobacteriaceae bacterium HetDA_MAG_MS6]
MILATEEKTILSDLNKHPNQIAIYFEDHRYTHQYIEDQSNQIAAGLLQKGVEKGDVIALMMRPSPQLIISLLGILKAGGVFLPLDQHTPSTRRDFILSDSSAKLCITDSPLNGNSIFLSSSELIASGYANLPTISQQDPAYIIYTSGTTGHPKGVLVSHESLSTYLAFAKLTYLTENPEVFALITSPAVDMTLTSIFLPLISGNAIMIFDRGSNIQNFSAALDSESVTCIKCTPTHLQFMTDENVKPGRLSTLIVGGEAFAAQDAKRIQGLYPNTQIFNEYGPTEATVGCAVHRYDPTQDIDTYVPIGHAIPGTSLKIMNAPNQSSENGEKGELYIGGKSLAEKYVNNTEETANHFVTFDEGTFYRTGDIVRKKAGKMYYLGRTDDQIKLNGYRIEPMEIEKVILTYPGVRNAKVIVKEKQLIVYLDIESTAKEEIYGFLSERLPSWMRPSKIFHAQNWITGANGKLDLETLQKHAQLILQKQPTDIDLDSTKAEEIRNMIAMVALEPAFEDTANLYEIGIDSLQLVALIVDLEKRFDCPLNMGQIMDNPIVHQLIHSVIRSQSNREVYHHLHSDSSLTTLHCFPPAIGGAMAFRMMVPHTASYLTCLYESPVQLDNPIEAYVQAISSQKVPNNILIGYSGGGNLAFEVGKVLEAQGHEIRAIILIDAYRKKQVAKTLAPALVEMKTEVLKKLPPSVKHNWNDELDKYYDLINFELRDFEGTVNADVFLLKSENREHFGNRSNHTGLLFKSWDDSSNNYYQEIDGFGQHDEMLTKKFAGKNFQIIEDIISRYSL